MVIHGDLQFEESNLFCTHFGNIGAWSLKYLLGFIMNLKKTVHRDNRPKRYRPKQPLRAIRVETSAWMMQLRFEQMSVDLKREFSQLWHSIKRTIRPIIYKQIFTDRLYEKWIYPCVAPYSEWCTNYMILIMYREGERIEK
jgi:hypothetical protein